MISGGVREFLETAYYAISLVGVPIAVVLFLKNEFEKVRLDKQRIYLDINDRYLDFLRLAAEHPRLDIAEYELGADPLLSREENLQQRVLFSFLTSIMERAYLLSRGRFGGDPAEWREWETYISVYCRKRKYRAFWNVEDSIEGFGSHDFDEAFEAYMKHKMEIALADLEGDLSLAETDPATLRVSPA